jgi:hypothetical protein
VGSTVEDRVGDGDACSAGASVCVNVKSGTELMAESLRAGCGLVV